jgi:mRNA interferase HigB
MFPLWEQVMQVVSRKTLKAFWELHPQAEQPLSRWLSVVGKARWLSPADIKADFGATVNFVGDNRVIFDIAGNNYRLVIHVAYDFKSVQVKFVGTHREYDRIDAETVGWT